MMESNYAQLVKALRCKDHPCDGCKYKMTIDLEDNCFTCDEGQLMDDAAAAIEALQAELEKERTAYYWGCKCEKMEVQE